MRTGVKKWTSVGAVVLMTGFGLVACGDEEGGSGGGGSSAVGEEAGTELTEENFFEETTKAQLEAGSSHVSMEMGGDLAMKAEGDVLVSDNPDDTKMAMTMEMDGAPGGGSFELRLVDGTLYMDLGDLTQGKFAKVDLSDASNPVGEQFDSMIDQMDPAKQLESLEGAVKSFEQTGEPEEIDGVEATPYVVTVDAKKVMEEQGTADDAPAGMPDELTYTWYIGPDNLPRRVTTDAMGQNIEMNFSKWGEDLTVEAPADGEITDQDPFGGMGG